MTAETFRSPLPRLPPLALAAPALAQTAPPPAISVTGEATVSVAPDLAQIDGGVTSEAKTAREASDANNAAMGKVSAGAEGRRHRGKGLPDLAAVAAAAICAAGPERPSAVVGYPRQQPRHHPDARRHEGRAT